jgi:hypothetical protein
LVRRLKSFALPDQRWRKKQLKNITFCFGLSISSLSKDIARGFTLYIFVLNSINMTLLKNLCLYKAKKLVI